MTPVTARYKPRTAASGNVNRFAKKRGVPVRTDAPRGIPGGAERDRTANLCLAKAALSQLSYGPGSAKRYVPAPRASNRAEKRLVAGPREVQA